VRPPKTTHRSLRWTWGSQNWSDCHILCPPLWRSRQLATFSNHSTPVVSERLLNENGRVTAEDDMGGATLFVAPYEYLRE
jgi:hypothetical protein